MIYFWAFVVGGAITAACHCAPPDNQPTKQELAACAGWFEQTVSMLPLKGFLALGQIGWRCVLDLVRLALVNKTLAQSIDQSDRFIGSSQQQRSSIGADRPAIKRRHYSATFNA